MKQRVQDLVKVADKLFSDRAPLNSLWQVEAENFHPMRADFTRARYMSDEFASYMMTGRPARCHRDLSNAFSAMLRPRDQQWFHARTDNELVNEDRDAKIWLDFASKTMRRAMYDRRANFVRATKEADGDFAAFGNAVITREVCDYSHLLYTCWHLRDCAWDESEKGTIDLVVFDWRPEARQLKGKLAKANERLGRFGISPKVALLKNDENFRRIGCRRIIIPSDEYDLPAAKTHGKPFVSIYVDVENQFVMEEVALVTNPTTIPRWARAGTMYGNQYGYSPAVIYGLPDARMMQQMMLSIAQASEMATNPPLITVGEAINGGVNWFASGIINVDADYDERTGAAVRPADLRFDGIKFGAEQLKETSQDLSDSFFLSKIRFPEIKKEMTAYESSKLWEDFIRESLPLFEPVEVEYNAAICGDSFQELLALNTFGPRGRDGAPESMPQILKGRELSWQFDTPITVAAEKALAGAFQAMVQIVTEGAQVDDDVLLIGDMPTAAREAVDGTGVPAKWLKSLDRFNADRKNKQQQAAAAAQAEAVGHGADVATRVATAASSAGDAAKALQGSGLGG